MNRTTATVAPASFSYFDMEHWLRVKAERSRLGITRRTEVGLEQPGHPLVGKTLVDSTTGTSYVVERVKKDWLQGWFLTALLNAKGSHRVCIVENHSSSHPAVEQQLIEYHDAFVAQH